MTRPIIDSFNGTRPQPRWAPRVPTPAVTIGAIAASIVTVAAMAACGGAPAHGPQIASVPGINATTRDGIIKLLNLTVPYPATIVSTTTDPRQCPPPQPDPALVPSAKATGPGSYPSGCDVPLNIRIFNDGTKNARLTGVKLEGDSVGTATVVLLSYPTAPSPTPSPPTPSTGAQGASGSAASARASGSARRRSSGAATPAKSPSGSAADAPSASSAPVSTPQPSPTPSANTAVVVDVPAGQLVMLTPGSNRYLAVRNLPNDLKVGGSVKLTFTFIYAGATGGTTAEHVVVPVATPLTALLVPSTDRT